MTAAALVDFLRRELAPTPGRSGATFRLTLACVIATIPILTHRIPHALLVLIFMYLITQEDTAATLLGSVLAVAGVTVGLGVAVLTWMVVLDIAWLRIACFVGFAFAGLWLKRVLVIGALGSALGVPAALLMIVPDIAPVPPESLVEFALWFWLCVALGLTVNLGVQLLLSPGDPLALLQREVDARLGAVEHTLRELARADDLTPVPSVSLDALATAGMSRPLALLRSASVTNAQARQRHDTLAATITLVDRLVTDAGALRIVVPSTSSASTRESLTRVADACARTRQAFAERRWPEPAEVVPAASADSAPAPAPLIDIERTLEQLSMISRIERPSPPAKESGPHLLVADATTNPEYVQFAVKGAVASLICYVLFVGFDYPGIYTSVITTLVVSLSTIGSSNQKGLLRFGGAAVGGVMGLFALVYAFPNIDRVGGFWLVFALGTAVAAWINFGSPRIAYGGYQTGLAFYKATLQKLGPAMSATVVRDRLIGVAFGLIVFTIVEHVLWPVRAADRMHARLADVLRSLAAFARVASRPPADVDARRQLIALQVADVQGFVEFSKFEAGARGADAQAVERLTTSAQIVFLVVLAIARAAASAARPTDAVQTVTSRADDEVATILEGLADGVRDRGVPHALDVDRALAALEQSITGRIDAASGDASYAGVTALYRELGVAVNGLVSAYRRSMTAIELAEVTG